MKEYATDSGAAIPEVDPASGVRGTYQRVWSAPAAQPEAALADDAAPAADQFAHLPLDVLVPSLTNPRKTFDAAKLAELADSIQASGVHQTIMVRPLPGSRVHETSRETHRGQKHQGYVVPTHEIVSGERRYRASVLAGVATIPARIRQLTDGQVLEIQIVENLQRDDLTALEEAEGYERLMQHSSLSADEVGIKISKSRSYVYARLKLLDLCLEAKQALRTGAIDTSRALLIARIPDGKLQIKAVDYASEAHSGEVPSVRLLQTWLRQNVMLPLDRAPFQITDARLVEAAGSCKDCPKRTGANPDLFAEVVGADICTDPGCYQVKASAHSLRNIARAEAKGMRYVSGAEAKAICYEKSSTLNGYSPLSQVRDDAGGQRLDQLLGKRPEGAVLIENPWTLALIEAVPTEETEGVLLAKGLVKAIEAPVKESQKTAASYAAAVKKIKGSTDARIAMQYEELLEASVRRAIIDTDDEDAADLIDHTVLLAHLGHEMGYEAGDKALQDLGLDNVSPESLTRVQIYKFAALYMANGEVPVQEAIAKLNGIGINRLREDAKEQVKTEVVLEIAALKKPVLPTTPLAQPSGLPVAGATPATPAALAEKKPAPLRKPRLSAHEAQSGIAEAMQGMEASPDGAEAAPLDQAMPVLKAGPQVNSQGSLAVGFAVGQRVQVTSDLDTLSVNLCRFAGKQGIITARLGDNAWDVTFRGRGGGLAGFDVSEIDVVQP
jgi:ParB/RepB/Spo0J family partition protein